MMQESDFFLFQVGVGGKFLRGHGAFVADGVAGE
jgi:hypothetical protein